jgi:hypothetical protein
MSLLSQLTPRHSTSVMTIRMAGSPTPVMPAVAPPDEPARVRALGRCGEDATRLTRALLTDGYDDTALARLEAALDEYVELWTPALHTTSRFELISSLTRIDDAITDIAVTFTEAIESGSSAVLLWLATGRFSRPAFFDDDHLVEPSGAVIRVAGASSVSFTSDHRADRIHCYYDRLGVVEQMLAAKPAGRVR